MTPHTGPIRAGVRDALISTLKRMNWAYGRGEIATCNIAEQRVTVQLQFGSARYAFHLLRDDKGRFWVRFRGRTRMVRKPVYTFKVV